MPEGRKRGRPMGTTRKDGPFLADVADLLVRMPALRPTTAMRRVIEARSDWLANSESAMLRRLQSKWSLSAATELAAAKRRAERIAPPSPRQISAAEIAAYLELAPEVGRAFNAIRSDLGKCGAAWRAIQEDLAEVGATYRARLEAIRGPFTALEKALSQYTSGGVITSQAVRTALGLA